MNKYWPAVSRGHKWRDRLRTFSPSGHFSATCWNSRQARSYHSTYQIGGCSTSILGQWAHSSQSNGKDPTGLGRFSWCRIQGKARQQELWNRADDEDSRSRTQDLIVVSAYRPCSSTQGPGTVWAQQRDYFLSKNRDENPRDAFITDLCNAIEEWTSWGCEILIGMDANEDLSNTDAGSLRARLLEAGLHEAILSRHPNAPATQIDNTKSEPIDGFFVSSGVKVQAGGYYGFYKHLDSDHRGLWLDIDLSSTLGGHSPKPRKSARRLNIANQNHVIFPTQEALFNRIHEDIRTVRRLAERKCRKIKAGGKDWSPKGQEIWDRIQLWRLLLDRFEGQRISSRKLRRLLVKTGYRDAYKWSIERLKVNLSDEIRLKRRLEKSNKFSHWRSSFIREKESSSRSDLRKTKTRYNREKSHTITRMRNREETRRRRRAQGKGFSGGLSMIQIERRQPDGSIDLISCSDQRLVEDGCMRENQERYDQTRFPFPTPPMKAPLYHDFTGPLAHEYVENLLGGRLELSRSIRPHTRAFLQQCRAPYPSAHLSVNRKSNNAFWRRNPEMKGSEPHGLHNGHYKAATFSSLLSACDAICRDIPLQTGIAPTAWRNLMNFAIEKKAGDFRVKKMRTIQMMDAEFQANNKLVGKKAMEFAETHSLIPPGQCGSRKKHQSIDLALSKTLVWDQLILRCQAAGWILNDAKSCFDRVVHWVAQVALRRFGIPWHTVDMMFRTLQMSEHRVRTGYGDSDRIFSPPSPIPFQGCGQGNGAGPTIWVAISSILIDTMEAAGHGFDFLSVLDWSLRVAECFCFVDDTDLVEAASDPDFQGKWLVGQIQRALSLWSECVRSTGGAINPEKSFWWMIDFKWDNVRGEWKFRREADDLGGNLWIKDLANRPVTLTRLKPNQTEKTLGIYMSPQFNDADQLKALTTKARSWATTVRSGSLLPYDVFPLVKTTIFKSLEYPMALTHFSETQWERIISPIIQVALPKAKICRSFPRDVVFGPIRYQGLGVPHPSGIQLTRHLDMLLRHPANHTTTGKYLQSCVQGHQLETGTSYGILQQDYSNTAILTSETWLKRVWRELEAYSVHVEFDSPSLQHRCEGDRLLMEVFMDAEVDQPTLKWLNWCRLHLHVTTISDIVTADGRYIDHLAWKGERASYSRSLYNWPRTVRPSEYWWRRWREVLRSSLLKHDSSSLRLATPLGPWTDDINDWNWLYSPSTQNLFRRHGHGWLSCPFIRSSRPTRTNLYVYKTFRVFHPGPLPADSHRVTVRRRPQDRPIRHADPARITCFLEITGVGLPAAPRMTSKNSILDYWAEFKEQCDGHYGWVPESIKICGSEDILLEALCDHKLRIISDGSYKAGVGSAATQITTVDRQHKIWIRCQTPGRPEDQSAYRSELIGILAGVQVVSWLRHRLKPPLHVGHISKFRPKVTMACDGKAALENSFDTWTLKPSAKQFDLISSIRCAVGKSAIDWSIRHVKGHQDETTSRSKLSWWALRNIECDARAKLYRQRLVRSGRAVASNPRFFTEPSSLFIKSVKQSRLVSDTIMELVTLPRLLAYWERRGRLNSHAIAEIDWTRMEKMMKALLSGLQRWTTKHAVGMCGVGKWKVRWKWSRHDHCPRCRAPEDHLHITRCPADSAQIEWDDRVANFHTWMSNQSTAPAIQTALLRFIRSIRDPSPPRSDVDQPIASPHQTLLWTAIASQKTIGAQCLLEGLLSKHWASLQTLHFRSIGSLRSGDVWYSKVAAQLIWIGFHMWQHRNGIQHSEENLQFRDRHRDANFGIREQFELGYQDLPPTVRPMLRRPRLEVLHLPLDEKERWVRLLRAERRLLRQTLERQRRMMRRHFPVIRRTGRRSSRRVRPRLDPPSASPVFLTQPTLLSFWHPD